jgi:c-di-GMP-binding flagellar brake protein YcgR
MQLPPDDRRRPQSIALAMPANRDFAIDTGASAADTPAYAVNHRLAIARAVTGAIPLSLIPVEKKELALGEPLPWALYDQDHKLLKAQGESIDTAEQLRSLLEASPLRELIWQSASEPSPDALDEPPEIDLSDTPEGRFTFYDMNLKTGDRIQLQPPPQLGPERHIVKLIGYLEPISVLVTTPMVRGAHLPVREGEDVVARVFSGQNAFGFTCHVKRVCKVPFHYLHLSFPDEIQGAIIRKSPRIRMNIIASIVDPDNEGGEPLSGMIVNISSTGARVDARKPLGTAGHKLRLSFRVNLHNMELFLTTTAVIRSILRDEDGGAGAQPSLVHHGVEFQSLQPNDSMILQSLIYQKMIEQPHTVV